MGVRNSFVLKNLFLLIEILSEKSQGEGPHPTPDPPIAGILDPPLITMVDSRLHTVSTYVRADTIH